MSGSEPWRGLADIVGPEHIRTDDASRSQAMSSWSPAVGKRKAGGVITPRVAAVALPGNADEVVAVVCWANTTRTPLAPVGGATNLTDAGMPTKPGGIALDLSRLGDVGWDEESLLVHAGAGATIGAIESRLNAHDYTLGYRPQSLDRMTVGGAVAMDAVGLFSGRYGRQSDLTLGLTMVLPTGTIMRTKSAPLGSASFDMHRLFIGSEGTLGIIVEATLQMRPVPEARAWAVFTFPAFETGIDALRLIYRSDARPACVRLLDASAATDEIPALRPDMSGTGGALLLAFEGDELAQAGPYQVAHAVCQTVGGTPISGDIGESWFDDLGSSRSWLLANARPDRIADAFAVSAAWSSLARMHGAIRHALEPLTDKVSTRIGHAGPSGAALDITYEAAVTPDDPEAARALLERVADAALSACVTEGGAVAHHYGVGQTRRRHFAEERGPEYRAALRAIKSALDPNDILPPVPE